MAGPLLDRLTPRIKETAKLVWKMYLSLTAVTLGALMLAGLPFYDALLHTFSSVATGGFSNQPLNLEGYGNPWAEGIVGITIFLGGMNFALLYRLLWLREWASWRNTEFV